MLRKLVALILTASFLALPHSYFVEASEEEKEETFPECTWTNPCEIYITDGDKDNPNTEADEAGSNIGFNVEDPNGDNIVRGHLLDWLVPEAYCDWYDCYYAYYYQSTRDYLENDGVGMTFSAVDGMFNFRAALEEFGYSLGDVTVNNAPRTLGDDVRGDDDGIIEDGEDWEYNSETCIEWRVYTGSPYIVKVDGKPLVSTNPEKYVHYLNYTQINEAQDCEANDGNGNGEVTMWGEGDFSEMEIVADESDEIAMALATAYQLDVGSTPVKYYYESQTYHIREDAEIRRGDAESEDSKWTNISLDYLDNDGCDDSDDDSDNDCDYILLAYFTINVSAAYPVSCEFGNQEGSPCNLMDTGEECEDPNSGSCFEAVLEFCEVDGGQACQEFLLAWYDSLLTFVCGLDESLIPFYFVNDNNQDCPLGADEQQYDDNGEPINWFDCADGNEVWIYQVNDDNSDCPNGEDEGINPDGDYDGVLNSEDNCPNTSENEVVDATGCSGSQLDDDQDGVSNDLDQCPDEDASDYDSNRDGCIDDSDNDGINDAVDNCPMNGEDVDATGCPEDDDGDGVSNANDACPETPANEESNGLGCSESQIRDEFQAEEITSLHYSIEMYNLTHGVMEEERYLNTNDSNYIRYQLWRLVEIYNVHNTYNSNISSIVQAYISERDSSEDWINHYEYKLQIENNLTILENALDLTYLPSDNDDFAGVIIDPLQVTEILFTLSENEELSSDINYPISEWYPVTEWFPITEWFPGGEWRSPDLDSAPHYPDYSGAFYDEFYPVIEWYEPMIDASIWSQSGLMAEELSELCWNGQLTSEQMMEAFVEMENGTFDISHFYNNIVSQPQSPMHVNGHINVYEGNVSGNVGVYELSTDSNVNYHLRWWYADVNETTSHPNFGESNEWENFEVFALNIDSFDFSGSDLEDYGMQYFFPGEQGFPEFQHPNREGCFVAGFDLFEISSNNQKRLIDHSYSSFQVANGSYSFDCYENNWPYDAEFSIWEPEEESNDQATDDPDLDEFPMSEWTPILMDGIRGIADESSSIQDTYYLGPLSSILGSYEDNEDEVLKFGTSNYFHFEGIDLQVNNHELVIEEEDTNAFPGGEWMPVNPSEIVWELIESEIVMNGEVYSYQQAGFTVLHTTNNGTILSGGYGSNQNWEPYGTLWRSADGGETWDVVSEYVGIVRDYHEFGNDYNSIIYAATDNGLYLSEDDGVSWVQVALNDENGAEISMKIRALGETLDGNSLLIGKADNRGDVYVTSIAEDFTSLTLSMAIDATGGQTEDFVNCGGYTYAAVNKAETGGLYRTEDITGYQNWEKLVSGNPHSLAVYPVSDGTCKIYLGYYDIIRVYSSNGNFDSNSFDTIEVNGYVEDFFSARESILSGGVGPYFIGDFPNTNEGLHLNALYPDEFIPSQQNVQAFGEYQGHIYMALMATGGIYRSVSPVGNLHQFNDYEENPLLQEDIFEAIYSIILPEDWTITNIHGFATEINCLEGNHTCSTLSTPQEGDVIITFTAVEDELESFSCPENSNGSIVCVCDMGFEGNLIFDQDEGWSGTCVASSETGNDTGNNSTDSDLTEEELVEIAEDDSLPGPSLVAVLILMLLISSIRRKE